MKQLDFKRRHGFYQGYISRGKDFVYISVGGQNVSLNAAEVQAVVDFLSEQIVTETITESKFIPV